MQPNLPPADFSLPDIEQTIAQRFEQQARRYPQHLALKCPDRSLTYDELNRAANRIARALIARIGTGSAPVALLCRGAAMIGAGLGALKAGRAYAPLDAQLPELKARQIFASLDNPLLLTDEKNFPAALKIAGDAKRILNVDSLDSNISSDNLGITGSPDSVAYINFTSGSTGEPKGVVWNHRSELFGIQTKSRALEINAGDRISLLRSNNVGAARDMYLALLNGATVVTLDFRESGLASLAHWLSAEEITVFSCVATIFRQAVQSAAGAEDFSKVRLVHIGGEPIFKSDVDLYKRYFPDHCTFVSRYSISETQAVSYYFIDKQTEIRDDRVPVGYPLPGSEVLILNAEGQELSAGESGEIAIRSRYLALEYWRQPELTRGKFIADPGDLAVRTYLTGDLGYRLPDGCLVHVGRKDFQTKVRGYRVELEAVEAALHQIAAVKQAVVVQLADESGGSRLIAYVAFKKSTALTPGQLRAELGARLPAYMMPAAFVFLPRLPVSAGGKVDRRALPAPPTGIRNLEEPPVAARSALEAVLLKIWRDALKLDDVGINDDFTELGGDSLMGAQIVGQIHEWFPVNAQLAGMFDTPTVARLAQWLIEHEAEAGQVEKIATTLLRVDALSDAEILEAVDDSKDGPAHE